MNNSFLDKLTYWHGIISDKSAIWFPFVFLRPKTQQMISFSRYVVMAFCFAIYSTIFFQLKNIFFNGSSFTLNLYSNFLKFLGFFLIWFSVVTRHLWNRRARELSRK